MNNNDEQQYYDHYFQSGEEMEFTTLSENKLIELVRAIENDMADDKTHANECYARVKAGQGKIDLIKEHLKQTMLEDGVASSKCEAGTIKLAKTAPRVIINVDEDNVPQEYKKMTYTVNKKAIKAGIEDGTVKFAELETNQSIRITFKKEYK